MAAGCLAVMSRRKLRVVSGIYINLCRSGCLIVPGKSAPTYSPFACQGHVPIRTTILYSTRKASRSSVHVANVPVPLVRLTADLTVILRPKTYYVFCDARLNIGGPDCPPRPRSMTWHCRVAKRGLPCAEHSVFCTLCRTHDCTIQETGQNPD